MFHSTRRSFLEKVGLGAGGFLLGPVAQSLISRAHGQASQSKRAVFSLVGAGISHELNFTPSDLRSGNLDETMLPGRKDFAWPHMMASLEKYRSRTLLIDGLSNRHKVDNGNHSSGSYALSNIQAANGAKDEGGPPGAITIDQYLGNALGAKSWRKTVLFGASTTQDAQKIHTFASGPLKPEAQYQSPVAMFKDIFAPLAAQGTDNSTARNAKKQRVLMDTMNKDIKRLQANLAPTEQRALDHYLAAMEDFEKRQQALSGTTTCKSPSMPMLNQTMGTVEDRLESMNEMAILALTCGLTNVVGIAMGCGDSHAYFPKFRRIAKGTPWEKDGIGETGHEPPDVHGACQERIHNFNCGLLARMADALSAVPEGNGNMFDNSVMLYMSDNGESHHAQYHRWPLVVLGTAGGKLRADGRFMRYPMNGAAGGHCTADLFCSMATACGVPTETFGKGGNEPVQGPLSHVMS